MPVRRRLPAPLLALAAAAGVVLLIIGIWLGGHPSSLPGPVRDALVGDKEARSIQTVIDAIEDDYYRRVPRQQIVDDSVAGAVRGLNDRFSNYFDPKQYKAFEASTDARFSGVGISVEPERRGMRVRKVFPESPAAKSGMRAGDLITVVNGRVLEGKPSTLATALIKGPPGTPVTLTVERGRRTLRLRMTRASITFPVVESRLRTVGGAKLADIELSGFTSGAHGELRQAIDAALRRGAKGIVLDLRGNGGGLLDEAVLVSSIFIPEGPVVSTDGRTRGRRVFKATGDSIPTRIPVVVLVDDGSASSAEIVTGALQDRRRALVVGTRTFGKGVFQEIKELPNGGAIELTVGEYFTPSGRNLGGGGVRRGRGIAPNVAAVDRPSTPRDEALDVALARLAREAR
jgi:carboxyl-terminal processing protease